MRVDLAYERRASAFGTALKRNYGIVVGRCRWQSAGGDLSIIISVDEPTEGKATRAQIQLDPGAAEAMAKAILSMRYQDDPSARVRIDVRDGRVAAEQVMTG